MMDIISSPHEKATVPLTVAVEPTPSKQTDSTCSNESAEQSLSARSFSYRVLYRGSLSFSSIEADVPLEGVCFVAHFDSRSPGHSALLSSPLPLALESQRGRPSLTVISVVSTESFDDRFDDSIDLRMYIHPQSLITRAYFERVLCMECVSRQDGRTKSCLRVQLGDGHDQSDDVVIYGQLIAESGTSCPAGLPKICIRVARVLPPRPKARPPPRPDDPLPRTLRFPAALKPKRTPSLQEISRPHKYTRVGEGPKHDVSTKTPNGGSTIAAQAKSFRLGSNRATGTIGRSKDYIRKKSSLSVVSTILEDGDEDGGDVFLLSPDRNTESTKVGDKQVQGLLKTLVKNKALPEVTTEEDSLHRSNKETVKRLVISTLTSRGIRKDNHEFKELYQNIVRGTIFALRQLMDQRRIEREEARAIINSHLEIYLPGPDMASYTPRTHLS